VVQWNGGNTEFFEIAMRDWIRMNVASDAGFGQITLSQGTVGRIAKNFFTPDYPHVKHRKCRAAFSRQPSGKALIIKSGVDLHPASALRAGVRFLSRRLRAAGSE
jgi:hypothetical protein